MANVDSILSYLHRIRGRGDRGEDTAAAASSNCNSVSVGRVCVRVGGARFDVLARQVVLFILTAEARKRKGQKDMVSCQSWFF